jgi:hypothetical protein
MHGRWLSVAVAGLAMAFSAAARGADSRDAREREARKACFTGNVDRGVEILVDLYGETGHPNYIYNQARCFERNGKYDQAVLSYEDYLRKATNLGEADRAQVEKSIAELRAKLASGSETAGAAAPALLTPTLDAASGPAPPPRQPDVVTLLPPATDDRPGAAEWPWQRTAGVMSLVAAGGGLAIGVAGTILRHSRGNDFNDACTYFDGQPMPRAATSGADCRGKYDAVQGADRMMWIGYVTGGVLAGAGATLLLLAPRHAQPQAGAVAHGCAPALAATTGVVCEWSF